jgi:hypothetical protein
MHFSARSGLGDGTLRGKIEAANIGSGSIWSSFINRLFLRLPYIPPYHDGEQFITSFQGPSGADKLAKVGNYRYRYAVPGEKKGANNNDFAIGVHLGIQGPAAGTV